MLVIMIIITKLSQLNINEDEISIHKWLDEFFYITIYFHMDTQQI